MAAPPPALIEGDGAPVVLVHGFALDGRMWASQVAALRKDHLVIVPDVLGFGPAGPTSAVDPRATGEGVIDAAADGLALLLDGLGIERAVVGGCSMGGYLALAFLRRHPGRLLGLILVDTTAAADTDDFRRARVAQAERVLAEGVGFLPEELLPWFLGRTSRAVRPAVVETVTRLILEQDPRAIVAAHHAMAARPDSAPLLSGVAVPTLVVVGAEDTRFPPAGARAMATAIPGAKFVKIPYAGHLPSLELPDELDRALRKFLVEPGQTTP